MQYISTSEIESKYAISRPTIGKWIEDALNKANNLQVIKVNSSVKIIDNPNNHLTLQNLAQSASKYKPKNDRKIVKPKDEFYKIYNLEQISNIYLNLLYKRSIDLKNVYKGEGQKHWDNYYYSKNNPTKGKVSELFDRFSNDLNQFISKFSKINLIDVGPGNGEPIKPILKILTDQNKLQNYISVDISEKVNEATLDNLQKTFKNIKTKSYIRDFEISHFSDIFLSNKDINGNESNIVFFIGSTINNCDDRLTIFKNLTSSLTKEDYIILSFTTDSPLNRAKVSYVNDGESTYAWRWLIELLGFDFDLKRLEGNYNNTLGRNDLSIILDKDYTINFELGDQIVPVTLLKNEKITFWKHYLISLSDIIKDCEKCNLKVIEYKLDDSGTVGMVVLKIA